MNTQEDISFEQKLRTAFSVFITPTLLTVVLFFLVNFYNDQKTVTIQQNQILVELGKINTKLEANQTKIQDNSKEVESTRQYLVSKVEENQKEILSLYKRFNQ